jgi:hypothetical protein
MSPPGSATSESRPQASPVDRSTIVGAALALIAIQVAVLARIN